MIAISYRREDTTGIAGRVYDRLQTEFGKPNVFMDFDSIPYGIDFREHIKETLEKAKCVVVVIGPEWYGHRHKSGRRIDDPNDFVRLEVAGALQRGIPVIPVLISGTPMPKAETLPSDIAELAFRNGLVLDSGIDFHHHADRLVSGIRAAVREKAPPPLPPAVPAVVPQTHHAEGKAVAVGLGQKQWLIVGAIAVVIVLVALSFWLVASQLSKRVSPSASSAFSPAPAPNPIQLFPSPTGNGNYKPGTEAPAGGIVDWNRKNPSPNPATRSTASPSPQKLFAGTWQGTVHYVLTAANGSTIRKWDSQIELPIDDSETHWGKMKEEGGVFRRGRTLAYTGVSTGNDGSKHQVHATLMVSEDGRTATYTNSSRPMGGNSNQRTFGKGTLEKID